MLGRRHRFHGLHSLDPVYRQGKTIRGSFCLVRYRQNPKRTGYRVAVVVSKKVSKSAVVRNRIRRRLYAAAESADIAPGSDIIITVFDEAVADLPADKLRRSLSEQLAKLPAAGRS
jgi:ribonuclease P protein component